MATRSLEDSSSPSWQETGTLAETNLHMLEHEILCDVTFLAGKAETPVKAHEFMLVSRSPVFYAMFCGPMAETKHVVAVPDVEANDLKELLRFMYSDNCAVSGENVMMLLYAANKYSVEKLAQTCRVFLTEHLGPDNVCVILQQAVNFNERELVKTCLSFVAEHSHDILTSENIKLLNRQTLKEVVELDTLRMDEDQVYKMCVEWGKHQCQTTEREINDRNIRECLGELLCIIRFPTMPIETFTKVVSIDDILTAEEKVEVFKSYFGISSRTRTFPTVSRNPPMNKDAVIERFQSSCISSAWGHQNKPDAISFSCSTKDLHLVGVSLFTPLSEGSVEGQFEILEGDTVLYRQEVKLVQRIKKIPRHQIQQKCSTEKK